MFLGFIIFCTQKDLPTFLSKPRPAFLNIVSQVQPLLQIRLNELKAIFAFHDLQISYVERHSSVGVKEIYF